jgi:hypothetical protein
VDASGTEVLIGNLDRLPANPAIGEYYAPLLVPAAAQTGNYRIRWRFRQTLTAAFSTVVQEWAVITDSEVLQPTNFSQSEYEMIARLRVLLRDNCFHGDTKIKVKSEDTLAVITLRELFDARPQNTLLVESISPSGEVEWQPIVAINRLSLEWEKMVRVETPYGTDVMTYGHRVFTSPTDKVEAGTLTAGDTVQGILDGNSTKVGIQQVSEVPRERFVYDLTVAEHHNFVLHESRMVVSNCPDRNYRFMPPEHEADVGAYNQVFGFVWEDAELLEYLRTGLDWWNMFPPETEMFHTLDLLVGSKPVWRTPVLWAAIVHAMFALTLNWSHQRFSVCPKTLVRVYVDGEEIDLTIAELYDAVYGQHSQSAIHTAFWSGNLYVNSVSLEGQVRRSLVSDVTRHEIPHKKAYSVTTLMGSVVCSEDHSLFLYREGKPVEVETGSIVAGDELVAIGKGAQGIRGVVVTAVAEVPMPDCMYDLTVPGDESFVLSNGLVSHNSYSIGGISLDIDKASGYESLKQNAEGQLDKATEAKARTVKICAGISQSRYGRGIRSSFGPATGRGVLGPRSFVG